MDSRSSLSILESEDTTLLTLSQDIDLHTTQLRNNVIQSIASIRSKIHAQTAEAMERQQAISFATEQRLIEQIENLQQLLEVRTTELVREKILNEKLIEMRFSQKRRERQREAAVRALRAWHRFVSEDKERRRVAERAIRDRQEREARSAFTAWRLQAQRHKFEKTVEKMTQDFQRANSKAMHTHQAAENAAKMEIFSLKEQIAQEEDRRCILEEKLKAAFMRGVCALNLEAMQVLRSTTDVVSGDVQSAAATQAAASQYHSGAAAVVEATSIAADDMDVLTRIFQRQQQLAAQLNSSQQQVADQHSTVTSLPPQQPSAVASVAPAVPKQPHQAFTVSINPAYKKPTAAAATVPSGTRKPATATGSLRPTSAGGRY